MSQQYLVIAIALSRYSPASGTRIAIFLEAALTTSPSGAIWVAGVSPADRRLHFIRGATQQVCKAEGPSMHAKVSCKHHEMLEQQGLFIDQVREGFTHLSL